MQLLRSCVVLDISLEYFSCVVIEHLKMHHQHSVCRNAQQICKIPLWLVLIVGLRRGYTFKEEYNLACVPPFSHCGNTSFAREVFKKGRTVQERLEAKADEVLTWILRIENISVVAPISQKHKKGRYTHLPGNGLAPSTKSCFLTGSTSLHTKVSLWFACYSNIPLNTLAS